MSSSTAVAAGGSTANTESSEAPHKTGFWALTLGTIGVVFIATAPHIVGSFTNDPVVLGHGVLVSELEARLRRIEQHLSFPGTNAN